MSLCEKIKELRSKGYTYNSIRDELGCSKGTISYHLGAGQKEKTKERRARISSTTIKIGKKVDCFKRGKRRSILGRATKFQRSGVKTFLSSDVYKIYGDVFKCALTGRTLYWDKPEEYEYDHIHPSSKGGSNEITNLQIVCSDANRSKHGMMQEDFINLCIEVVINAGYKISKLPCSM